MRDGYSRNDPVFIDWAAGQPVDPAERYRPWPEMVRENTGRGVEMLRARIVSEPISEYIRFEGEVTKDLNIAAGEDVRWLPRRRATDLTLPGNDFWLFDDGPALINHFDGEGDSTEHEIIDDPSIVSLLASAFDAVWERAVPHAEYWPA
ncbi:DUF6879 family protein [Haloactinopolyspora alba]